MLQLDKAIIMATKAHEGQVDKSGLPYILHPLRVMLRMQTDEERIVAVLHDTLEDTKLDREEIRETFGIDVLLAILALTRESTETYFEYIKRLKSSDLARKVKISDLMDNMMPERLSKLPEQEQGIVTRYQKALKILS